MITQHVVTEARERVEAVVLMDTSYRRLELDPDLVEAGAAMARSEGIDVVADVMAAADDGPLVTEAYRRKVAQDPDYARRGDRNLRASSPAMFAAMLMAISGEGDRLAELTAIDVPTLVLVGEQDEPFLEPSREMAAAIPGARLVVVPGGGHSPQLEATDAWWDALSGFLAQVADATA